MKFKALRAKAALASMLAAAVMVGLPTVSFAGFAPSNRPTFQCVTPTDCPGANYVTFNSFTNAPNYGDERAFFDGKDAGIAGPGGYQDKLNVQNGQRLVLRTYIHNNANPGLIGEAAATAHNTRLQVLLPTSKKTANQASAQITADNANPGTVSDSVDFAGASPFTLAFDTNAPVQITYRPNGTGDYVTRTLPAASFSNAVTLNAALGDFKGCFEYSVLITMTVVVSMDQTPPPASFNCSALNLVRIDRTRYTVTANATVVNTNVQSYTFTVKNSAGTVIDTKNVATSALTAVYNFNQQAGKYTINAVVNTDRGSTNPNVCQAQITVEEEGKPPVTPITTASTPGKLPAAGAGSMIAIFVATTAAGSFAYYTITRRRLDV